MSNHHWNDNLVIEDTFIKVAIAKPRYAEQVCCRRWIADLAYRHNPADSYWDTVRNVINYDNRKLRIPRAVAQNIIPLMAYYGVKIEITVM
jgi:hypothetical protein